MSDPKSKQLSNPGDVSFKTVEIQSVNGEVLDIKNFIVELNIYEDIFSNALQGVLIVVDSKELLSGLPLVGDELLNLWVQTPSFGDEYGESIKKTFSIYSIKNRMLNADREQMYALYFCSMEAVSDNITQVSKKYEGTTDEIADKLYTDYLKQKRCFGGIDNKDETPMVIADTPHEGKIAFVANMWSPFRCLNYVAQRSIGAKQKSPSFLFYETTRQFYFTSIDNLIKSQLDDSSVFAEYVYLQKPVNPETNLTGGITFDTSKPGLDKGFNTVSDIRFNEQVDILKSQDQGRFASTTTIFDIMIKEATNAPHDYSYSYPDIIHMENYRIENGKATFDEKSKDNMTYPANVTRSALSKRFFRPVHRKVLTTSDDELLDYAPDKWLGMRQSVLEDISGLRMHITVPGRTDAEVGKIINFKYPKVGDSADKSDPKNHWDPFLSGVWMITAIHHKMTPVAHNMILEIAKDSFHTAFQAITRAPAPTPPAADDPEVQADQQNGVSPSSPGPINKAGWTHPTGGKGRITSKTGPRQAPTSGASTGHKGYDIGAPKGTPVFAAKDGTVIKAGWQNAGKHYGEGSGYGLRITIDHGGGYTSVYAHANEGSLKVKVGDKVKAGQQIMQVNNTGNSTGHHLHFEINLNGKFQDPGPYIS
jgi:murein DD-endopeptidase MepM/ murein hydrolase activator NlpD